jgi:diketogulonate reductase-like aldo/keto reductase
MQEKPFGDTGELVPVLGQGTWDVPLSGTRRDEARNAIRYGIDCGMRHIDTAEMYGAGAVEKFVGDAVKGLPRADLFVASKVLPSNASYSGTIDACERTLRRMGLDYLDLYMLHWPSDEPLSETMRALEALVKAGKTRFIGVSNFDVEQMLEAKSYLRDAPLACNQVLYHLAERGIERRLIPAARDAGVAVVAYTPFGRGRFPRVAASGDGVLARVAAAYGATPRQVILAFLTRETNVFAIPKASTMEHVEENADAGDLTLAPDDVALIDAAFPAGEDGPLATL